MANDNTLAKRIGRGDREADEQFLELFGACVHRLARRYAGPEADAEDLTQEIFVDLFRCAATFRGESALATWVLGVAYNHCNRHRARQKPPPESLEGEFEPPDDAPDPASRALRNELSGQVRLAVDGLSPLQRDVVLLHEIGGLTYPECATILGVPVGTVKSRLSNAFSALRLALGHYVLNDNDEPTLQPTAPIAPRALRGEAQ